MCIRDRMLVPDELCADIYNTQVAPYMTEGKALAFAPVSYTHLDVYKRQL